MDLNTSKLFKNYLRGIYQVPTKLDIPLLKTALESLKDSSSWCTVYSDEIFLHKLLSYYLVSNKCPEFMYITTVDLVEERFNDEDHNPIKMFSMYSGILIIHHSHQVMRNKLQLETLMTVLQERTAKGKSTIVTSTIRSDVGEHTYYDHSLVLKKVSKELILFSSSSIKTRGYKSEKSVKHIQKSTPDSSETSEMDVSKSVITKSKKSKTNINKTEADLAAEAVKRTIMTRCNTKSKT